MWTICGEWQQAKVVAMVVGEEGVAVVMVVAAAAVLVRENKDTDDGDDDVSDGDG